MKHLITGAGGFLGSHLIDAIRERFPQDSVVSLGLRTPAAGIAHTEADLLDSPRVQAAFLAEQPDRVYHLAGSARVTQDIDFAHYYRSNFQTTESVVAALRALDKPVRVFFSSSVHVYGNQQPPEAQAQESDEPRPSTDYGMSKYLCERALEVLATERTQLKIVVGRLYSCIGPGQGPGFVTADLARKLAALPADGSQPLQTGPLDAVRRFLDVRDAARLIRDLLASGSDAGYEIVNIASPNEMTVQQIVEKLIACSGKQVAIESTPSGTNAFRGLRVSLNRLEERLPGFQYSSLDSTLKDILKEHECKTRI